MKEDNYNYESKEYSSLNDYNDRKLLSEDQEVIFFENIAKVVLENKLHGDAIKEYFDNKSDTFAHFLINFEKYDWFEYSMGYDVLMLLDTFLDTYIELQKSKMTHFGEIGYNNINPNDKNLDNFNDDLDSDLDDEQNDDWWKK